MVRGACIDIGSNTTRLLVADFRDGRLEPVVQERVFTHIGRGRSGDGTITPAKIAEVAQVVADQLRRAREVGAGNVRAVATAAIRKAGNSAELVSAVESRCGLKVEVLSGEEEARLAFVGAAHAMGVDGECRLGVVDVGGGSCELVVGEPPDTISWSASFTVGSSDLTHQFLHSDPPAQRELEAARSHVAQTFGALVVPPAGRAVAVGGSATSLGRVTGPLLDGETFARALAVLSEGSAGELARRFGLVEDRVRLLPAGLLLLQSASDKLGLPLIVGAGGIREGVLLEACRG